MIKKGIYFLGKENLKSHGNQHVDQQNAFIYWLLDIVANGLQSKQDTKSKQSFA